MIAAFEQFLRWLQGTAAYDWSLVYFAAYPIATSILWVTMSIMFRLRWEQRASGCQRPRMAAALT